MFGKGARATSAVAVGPRVLRPGHDLRVTPWPLLSDPVLVGLRSPFGALEDRRQLALRESRPVLRIVPDIARFRAIEEPEARRARIETRADSAHGADDPSLIVDCYHSQRPWLHVHPQNGDAPEGKVHAQLATAGRTAGSQRNRCRVRPNEPFANANLSRARYKG